MRRPDSRLRRDGLEGYDFWFEDVEDADGTIAATLENLNSSIDPTTRLTSVEAAYWTSVGTKEHLRWVMPHDEETLLDALARLHAAGADQLGSTTPGWSARSGPTACSCRSGTCPVGTGAEAIEEPALTFADRLADALAESTPSDRSERSARNGLANRQITIR